MIPLETAREMISETIRPLETVRLPLRQSFGRVLREDIVAEEDLPAFNRSAMDGYALAGEAKVYEIVGEVQAGPASPKALKAGEGVRIFTGGIVPEGADRVVRQEDVDKKGNFIVPHDNTPGTHIRWRGEDSKQGDVLLRAGGRLGATEAALLAQLGRTEVPVTPAPRILHLATGNELVDPSAVPQAGEIRDSNSTLLAALLAARGADVVGQLRCGDSLEKLVAAIKDATASWDVLLISGGASVGDYDFGAKVLHELGFQMHFERINLRPGKPLIFATRESQVAFIIPGNPVSHFVTFHVAIAHALDCLEGRPPLFPMAAVHLTQALPKSATDPRHTWWPAEIILDGGALTARPLSWQSSGDLSGIAGTSGLIYLPPGTPPKSAGSVMECLLLDHRFPSTQA